MANIIVVEDDLAIAETILFALKREGHFVKNVTLGSEALDLLQNDKPELMILDVGLPDINGFALCKKIRERSSVPVLFLTAHADHFEREMGFELGADDYVTKPFSLKELVLRVQALLRRSLPTKQEEASLFVHDDVRKHIQYCQQVLTLTRAEYLLLFTLLSQPERVFSREQLLMRLPNSDDSGDRVIDTLVKQLRAKLREVNAQHDAIITHRGLGYSISVKPS